MSSAIADAGFWVYTVAQGWLVLKLTNSPLWLGVVAGAGQVPYLLFTLAGGSLADRFDRRALIAIGNALVAALALALAFVVARGHATILELALLAFGIGIVIALEHPVDRAWLYDLVNGEALGRAIALSSLEWSVARTVGPAIGGIALAGIGVASGYAVFAAAELPMVGLALAVGRTRNVKRASSQRNAKDASRSYADLDRSIVAFSLVIAAFTIGITPYIALLPDVAHATLHADARGFGFLSACGGAGAVGGALWLSAMGETRRKGRIVPLAMALAALVLAAFAFSHSIALSSVLLVALGVFDTLVYALANTYVQELAVDGDRGRANGVFSLAFLGGIPIGNVAVGALAEKIGTGPALACSASLAFAASAAFWLLAPRARDAT